MGAGSSKQLQQNFDSLQIETNSYKNENENYKSQIKILEQDKQNWSKTKTELDTKIDTLNNTNNQCQVEKKVCFRDKKLLNNNIIEKDEELKVCRTKNSKLNMDLNKLEEKQKKLKEDFNEKSNNLKQSNSNYLTCQKTNADLMKKNAELMQQIITIEAKCSNSSLNEQVIELTNNLGQVKNTCNADKNKFDLDIGTKNAEITALKNEIANIKELSSSSDVSAQTRISSFENEISNLNSIIENKIKEIESLQTEKGNLQTNIDNLDLTIQNKDNQIELLNNTKNDLDTNLQQANSTINNIRQTIEDKQGIITDKEAVIQEKEIIINKVMGIKDKLQEIIETNEIKAVHGLATEDIRTTIKSEGADTVQECIVRAKYTPNAVAYIYATSRHPDTKRKNKCTILSRHDKYEGGYESSPSKDMYHITGCVSKDADGKIKDITKEHCG